VLYKADTFTGNFARAALLILCRLVFLACLGALAASFLSFPVAILFCVVIFFTGTVSGFIVESFGYMSENTSRIYAYTVQAIIQLLPQFDKINPTKFLVPARLMTWSFLGQVCWSSCVACAAALGLLIFRFRAGQSRGVNGLVNDAWTAILCVGGIVVRALLIGAGAQLDSIGAQRQAMGLTMDTQLEKAPPSLVFATVALGAFRGLVVDILWMRADSMKEAGQFFDARQLAEWITTSQPRFASVGIPGLEHGLQHLRRHPREPAGTAMAMGQEWIRASARQGNPPEPEITCLIPRARAESSAQDRRDLGRRP
jgi:hypothetical protein